MDRQDGGKKRVKSCLTPLLAGLCLITSFLASGMAMQAAVASQAVDSFPTSDDLDLIDPNYSKTESSQNNNNPLARQKSVNPEMHIAALQVLLDREGFSPGAINGIKSDHFTRIVRLYEQRTGHDQLVSRPDVVRELLLDGSGEAFVNYTLSAADIAGPFLADLPARIQDQKALGKLHYLRVEEAIAERFHMDEAFLEFLNPDGDFGKVGTVIKVANIGKPLDRWVGRIHADKHLRQVTSYDQQGRILGVYPASIGSVQTPSPKGVFKVRNKAGFPAYTLAPDNGFEPVDDGRQVIIAPGPNNPVGAAWIGLSKKTYGIHGTPEPSNIGSAESHGCIRLTNWDAMELARLVRTGVEVVID